MSKTSWQKEKTPYERRFGEPFEGPIIPFGAMVEYHPVSAKDQSTLRQFGKKVLPGLFLGYALFAGGIWNGDVLIADLEELETMDASEIYSKRLNAKEVIFPKQGEFIFPIADGRIKTLGGDQELRTSTLVRHRPIQGESNIDFLGESEGSLPQPQDSFPDAGEAINDFWSMSGSFIYRHHVEPRVKLYSPREESFPIPLKYIDVSRTTHRIRIVRGENLERRYHGCRHREFGKFWTLQKSILGDSKTKEIITPKSARTANLSVRDHGVRESTPTRDQPGRSEDLRDDVQGNSEKSQTKQEMT